MTLGVAGNETATGTLASSTQSAVVGPAKRVDVSLSGTWAGTVALQRKIAGNWFTMESYTENSDVVVDVAARLGCLVRLDFTRNSGSLVYVLEAGGHV